MTQPDEIDLILQLIVDICMYLGVFSWGHSQGTTAACGLSQALGGGWRRGLQQIFQLGFSMLHPFVLPQPLFRIICIHWS